MLPSTGVVTLAVGVGDNLDLAELEAIAQGDPTRVLGIQNFASLAAASNNVTSASIQACEGLQTSCPIACDPGGVF